ncbi:MAG: lipopolysaccharide heptosyltransferase I [Selenomonas artemidis]|nr:lipopolysaccharide heptosyltransferase I [Selenomonas artemidis]
MNSVLIVKLSAIGDVVHALPAAYAIKETYPAAHITWVVEPPAYDIVRMCPSVDEVLVFPKKELRTWAGFRRGFPAFRRLLRVRRYDAALDLQGLFKSAAIAFFVRARRKIGTGFMREGAWLVSRPVRGAHIGGHIVDQNLDVARALGCAVREIRFPLQIPADAVRSAAEKRTAVCGGDRPYAVLIVGASRANKIWRAAHFARLAGLLRTAGITPLLVGGGAADEQRAAEIAALSEEAPPSLVGRTTFPELAALLRGACVVVGGDTGPTHLSDAVGAPTLMLMGSWPPARNGLYRQRENVIEIDRPCRHCMKRVCPLGLDCLDVITPEQVMDRVGRLVSGNA